MTKKQLQELVLQSYMDSKLNEKKVAQAVSLLKRKELKQYLKLLKQQENKRNIIVSVPHVPTQEEQKALEKLFNKKQIVYNIDPDLLVGIRIVNNDLISEYSLRETLQDLLKHVTERYEK